MNLLDDIEVPKQPDRLSLTQQATKLVNRRSTRRSKKKKPKKSAKWNQEFAEAMKIQKTMKKERAQQFQDFERLIEKE